MESVTRSHLSYFILAGFGSFPGAPCNPSERLIQEIRQRSEAGREGIATLILPVEWQRSWLLLEAAIARLRPHAVLLFGLHAGAERLRLETTAANERRMDMPDAAGRFAPSRTICPDAPSERASLPIDDIRARFEAAGIEHELSHDAGRYLCNETLFMLCRSAERLGLRRYGFVHTPLTEECAAAMRAAGTEPPTGARIEAARLAEAADVVVACLRDELALLS